MKILLRIFVVLFSFYFTVSIFLAVEELAVKAPWYTYENMWGDRLIMGQEPATLTVLNEKGKAIDKIKGYAFTDSDKTVTRVKGTDGKYVYVDNSKLPGLLQTVDTLFYPALSVVRSNNTSEALPGALLLLVLLALFILCMIFGGRRRKKI